MYVARVFLVYIIGSFPSLSFQWKKQLARLIKFLGRRSMIGH